MYMIISFLIAPNLKKNQGLETSVNGFILKKGGDV